MELNIISSQYVFCYFRYYVQLPNGRLMVVDYYVDRTGYHPTITYEDQERLSRPNPSQNLEESQAYSQTEQRPNQDIPQTGSSLEQSPQLRPRPNQGYTPFGGRSKSLQHSLPGVSQQLTLPVQ